MSFFEKRHGYFSQKLFESFIEWEIYKCLLPQIEEDNKFDYIFNSAPRLSRAIRTARLDVELNLQRAIYRAKQAPEGYNEAIQYILFRDINRLIEMYIILLRKRAINAGNSGVAVTPASARQQWPPPLPGPAC